MDTISIELRVQMKCAGCDAHAVVPGLVGEVRCPACGKTARVELARWSRALDEPVRKSLENPAQDWRWHGEDPGADVGLRFEYKRWAPVCPTCRAPIATDALGTGDLTCGCGATIAVRELPGEIEALGLPRPAWLVGEGAPAVGVIPRRVTSGAWLDSIWVVARLSHALGTLTRSQARSLHGVAFDRSGALVVLFREDEHGRIAGLGDGDELRWLQSHVHVDSHAYLIGSPGADEVAVVDPKANCLHLIDTRDGSLVRTLQGPAPAHEDRHAHDFRRREPQTIDVHDRDFVGVGIGPDGTIAIARNWYDDLGKSLRRFDREGRPLAPWRRRPGFLARMFGPEDPPSWRDLGDRPLALNGWTDRFAVARNGALLAYGKEGEESWLQRWQPDGTVKGAVRLPDWVCGVRAIGGDAQGTPVLLLERGTVDERDTVVATLHDATLDVIAGPFAGNESYLDVHDDGRIVIAGRGDSLRVLAPDGRVVWRSAATVHEDRKREESMHRG